MLHRLSADPAGAQLRLTSRSLWLQDMIQLQLPLCSLDPARWLLGDRDVSTHITNTSEYQFQLCGINIKFRYR